MTLVVECDIKQQINQIKITEMIVFLPLHVQTLAFQRKWYNMAQKTDASTEDILKGAISHQKKYLSENVLVTDFLDLLLSEGVIEQAKEEEIQACLSNKGKTNAASLFWSMLLRDEIPVITFVETIQKKTKPKHWTCDKLDEFVAKVKSGEWPLYGEPDFKSRFQYFYLKFLK